MDPTHVESTPAVAEGADPLAAPPALQAGTPGPVLDLRTRWRGGQLLLTLGGVLTLASFLHTLAPGRPTAVRLATLVLLGVGVVSAALLASLKGRGRAEQLALYVLLALAADAIRQGLAAQGWPGWPLLALLVAGVAIAEPLLPALGIAALAGVFTLALQMPRHAADWRLAGGECAGYLLLGAVLSRAQAAERRRLEKARAELTRLTHGLDQLEDSELPGGQAAPAALALRQVWEGGRRARHLDRSTEMWEAVGRLLEWGHHALATHSLAYFELDHTKEIALLRAGCGPKALLRDATVPLATDPFPFVLERRQPFYATDFPRLLHALPWYRGQVAVGTLLAEPVFAGQVVVGVLVADRVEVQAFGEKEQQLVKGFAALFSDEIGRARATFSREDTGLEFKAVYEVSRKLSSLQDRVAVQRLLLRSARELVEVDGGAIVALDEAQTRYVVEEAQGWPKEFQGREVAMTERTWAGWVLRSAQDPVLLDDVADRRDRMPLLVLDEGGGRAESLLAVPLSAGGKAHGALVLTGKRGAFDAATTRVLGLLCNQAAAALATIQLLERIRQLAVRDGLTGLYNRRAFNELLEQTIAREDRQQGRMALLLFDLDHFKKLNDSLGHQAGDAALRGAGQLLQKYLRKGDIAARYGGEEFAAILPDTDIAGAKMLAERVREGLESWEGAFAGARLRITASIGLAIWPDHAREITDLLSAADAALYEAKSTGRNRVVTSDRPVPKAL